MYDYDRILIDLDDPVWKQKYPLLYERYKHFVDGAEIEIVNNYSTIKIRVMKGNNLVVDGFKGSFGQITVTRAKDGDGIMKQKIQNMTNPNTELQQGARSNFKTVGLIGSAINPFLREKFEAIKVLHSPYNSFLSINTPRKPAGGGETPALNIEEIQWTNGNLYSNGFNYDAAQSGADGNGGFDMYFSWAYDANSSLYDGTDEVRIFVFNTETYAFQELFEGSNRSDAVTEPNVPIPSSGDNLVAVFFQDVSTGAVSSEKAVLKLSSAGVVTVL